MEGMIFKHRKTGVHYTIVGECMLEETWEVAVLYQRTYGVSTLPIARNKEEFLDGRFIHVTMDGTIERGL